MTKAPARWSLPLTSAVTAPAGALRKGHKRLRKGRPRRRHGPGRARPRSDTAPPPPVLAAAHVGGACAVRTLRRPARRHCQSRWRCRPRRHAAETSGKDEPLGGGTNLTVPGRGSSALHQPPPWNPRPAPAVAGRCPVLPPSPAHVAAGAASAASSRPMASWPAPAGRLSLRAARSAGPTLRRSPVESASRSLRPPSSRCSLPCQPPRGAARGYDARGPGAVTAVTSRAARACYARGKMSGEHGNSTRAT